MNVNSPSSFEKKEGRNWYTFNYFPSNVPLLFLPCLVPSLAEVLVAVLVAVCVPRRDTECSLSFESFTDRLVTRVTHHQRRNAQQHSSETDERVWGMTGSKDKIMWRWSSTTTSTKVDVLLGIDKKEKHIWMMIQGIDHHEVCETFWVIPRKRSESLMKTNSLRRCSKNCLTVNKSCKTNKVYSRMKE